MVWCCSTKYSTNKVFGDEPDIFSLQYGPKDQLTVSAGVREMRIAPSFDLFLPFLRFLCFQADSLFKAL